MASAVSAPKIISVSILHRHGARGPGGIGIKKRNFEYWIFFLIKVF
jgi:hypothetical protein